MVARSINQPDAGGGWRALLFWTPLVEDWELIRNLTKRQIAAKYRGSVLGLLWVVATPLIMLTIYTYVFSIIFAKRWDMILEGKTNFALFLFAGLCCHQMIAECLSRAPSLLLENKNYVKKVIFPLATLPWVLVLSASFTFCVNLTILLIMYLLMFGLPPLSIALLPLALFPLLMLAAGLTWVFSALGVFFRDLKHVTTILVTLLLFLTPIFYPLQAVPEQYQIFVRANPLAEIVETVRSLTFYGEMSEILPWLLLCSSSLLLAAFGYALFNRISSSFADVL
ncbi:MAG: ABC transporter permease [Geminicoccaceae bacterium]